MKQPALQSATGIDLLLGKLTLKFEHLKRVWTMTWYKILQLSETYEIYQWRLHETDS